MIDIPASTPAEHDFLVQHFDVLFPPEHPLDLPAFLSLAKLVLVRRIVKTLVRHHGLHRVQRGMRSPIVVDLVVREVIPVSGLVSGPVSGVAPQQKVVGEEEPQIRRRRPEEGAGAGAREETWEGGVGEWEEGEAAAEAGRKPAVEPSISFGRELLRVHTVAPITAPGVDGFRLGAIVESPSPRVKNGGGGDGDGDGDDDGDDVMGEGEEET
jgi:hypothetical protein